MQLVSTVATGCVLALGALRLTGLFSQLRFMGIPTAICFILASISILLHKARRTPTRSRLGYLSALALTFFSSLVFLHSLGYIDLAHFDLYMIDTSEQMKDFRPVRFPPHAPLNFIFTGLALLLWDKRTQREARPTEFLACVIALVAALALAGYTGEAKPLHSAIGFFLTSIALLFARPDRGLMAHITEDSKAGNLFRRLILPAIVLPFIIVIMQWWLTYKSGVSRASGEVLSVGLNMGLFLFIIWKSSKAVSIIDNERKQALSFLKERSHALEVSKDQLTQFAYVAFQNLEEPLRMVTSYTQLLTKNSFAKFDQNSKKYVNYVLDSASIMRNLVNDFLTYSMVEGNAEKNQAIDCNQLVKESIDKLTSQLTETQTKITYTKLPIILGNHQQLLELFQKLIASSIKLADPTTPEVNISSQENKYEWVFWIHTNGKGLDPQLTKKFFGLFRHSQMREEHPNSPISFAVCRKIVEGHAGRIWVESHGRDGSTFYFTIARNIDAQSS